MDTSEICEQAIRNIRRIIRVIDLHSKKLALSHGLTGPQALILRELSRSGGIPVSLLAKKVSLSHATVTDILNRLSNRGLVVRTQDHQDRRRYLVNLTDKGKALTKQTPSILQEKFVKEFSKLEAWEQTQILSTLQRLARMMDAGKLDAAPYLAHGPLDSPETEI